MQNQRVAAEIVVRCRHGAKQHGVLVEECSAGVLHAPKRKARNEDQVVLGKRKRLCKVSGEVSDAACGHLLNLRGFLPRAVELRFAHVDSWFFWKRRTDRGEWSRREREQ